MKERESNFELLRIIAFIMIVICHITSAAIAIIEKYTFSWYYATIVKCLAQPAIIFFALISGYFAYSKKNYNVRKNLKRIFFPILCYIPMLFIIYIFQEKTFIEAINKFIYDGIIGVGFMGHLWYVVCYIFIILFTPLLVRGIDAYTKKQIKCFLIVMYIFIGVSELIILIKDIPIFSNHYRSWILFLIIIFLTGCYINKYDVKINKKVSLIIVVLMECVRYTIFLLFNHGNDVLNSVTIQNFQNIFIIIESIAIFLLFKDLKMKNNKKINFISNLTYGAYIIHVFYIFFNQKFFAYTQYAHNPNYYLYDIAYIILVVIFSLLTELVRQRFIFWVKKGDDK